MKVRVVFPWRANIDAIEKITVTLCFCDHLVMWRMIVNIRNRLESLIARLFKDNPLDFGGAFIQYLSQFILPN